MCDNYEEWPSIEEWIQASFPQLQNGRYEETSAQTCLYNCIGWAADDTENWWWPSEDELSSKVVYERMKKVAYS